LKTTRQITVHKATKYVNETLLKGEGMEALVTKYKLKPTVAEGTVHTWMLRAGAVYKAVNKTY
jgi:hypothetical protein